MPLSINVGLSRKASKDYQSTGVSINVTAELDQSLLAKPDELLRQIDDLYGQAERAIDRQVCAYATPEPRQDDRNARYDNRGRNGRPNNGHQNNNGGNRRNGHNGGNGNGSGGGMTDSQRRAIEAIAGRLDLNPAEEIQHEFGLEFNNLTLREASRVIDHLKTIQPAPESARNGNGKDGGH